MPQTVKIFTDSTNDLSKEILDKYDIDVVPLYAVMGEVSRKDGVEVNTQELLAWSDANKTTPKTSAVAVQDYIDAFTPYIETGRDIVYIGLSSAMSSTVQNAHLAASEFDDGRVEIVDSQNLSSGIGYLVLEGAIMAVEGKTAAEIRDALNEMVPKISVSFIIDTLVYLHRGGRCSTLQFLGANMLSLKPEIIVKDGKMTTNRKYRGTLSRALERYIKDHLAEGESIDPRRIFITHSPMAPELVQSVREQVEAAGYFKEVIETDAGCVITSHCGPNCLGVIYLTR